jgi:hypothetical protein
MYLHCLWNLWIAFNDSIQWIAFKGFTCLYQLKKWTYKISIQPFITSLPKILKHIIWVLDWLTAGYRGKYWHTRQNICYLIVCTWLFLLMQKECYLLCFFCIIGSVSGLSFLDHPLFSLTFIYIKLHLIFKNIIYQPWPSSVKSTSTLKNINPLDPGDWPPHNVLTQPT